MLCSQGLLAQWSKSTTRWVQDYPVRLPRWMQCNQPLTLSPRLLWGTFHSFWDTHHRKWLNLAWDYPRCNRSLGRPEMYRRSIFKSRLSNSLHSLVNILHWGILWDRSQTRIWVCHHPQYLWWLPLGTVRRMGWHFPHLVDHLVLDLLVCHSRSRSSLLYHLDRRRWNHRHNHKFRCIPEVLVG